MINSILTRIVGTKNERELKRIRPVVERIGSLEPTVRGLDDRALAAETAELRGRLAQGATLDDLLPEAFAVGQYLPKGTDISTYSQARLKAVARQLNTRPRKTLNYETPAERFHQSVAFTG